MESNHYQHSNQQLTKESYLQAINGILSKEVESINKADTYLRQVSKRPEIFSLSLELLNQQDLTKEILFYSSKFLKDKFLYDYGQFKHENPGHIAETLITTLAKNQQKAQNIKTMLMLSLQMPDFLGQISQVLLQTENPHVNVLELLKLVAEEAENTHVVIDEEKREQYIYFLKNTIFSQVLMMLNEIVGSLKTENINYTLVQYKLLGCLKSWLDFNLDEKFIPTIFEHSVFQLALEGLSEPELTESSSKILKYVVKHLDAEKFPQYVDFFGRKIVQYMQECDKVIKEELYDEAYNYISVIRKFGEVNLGQLIVSKDQFAINYFLYLLKTFENTDLEEIFEEMTQFWSLFCMYLQDTTLSGNEHKQLIPFYNELYPRLIKCCVLRMLLSKEHLKFLEEKSDDSDNDGDDAGSNEPEDFEIKNKERFYVKQLLCDIQQTIGFSKLVEVLAGNLVEIIPKLTGGESQDSNYWKYISLLESYLYGISALFQSQIDIDNIQYLREVLGFILNLKVNVTKIKKNSISIIGKSSHLLNQMPEIIPQLFQYLSYDLHNQKTQDFACKAVCDLCKHNPQFVLQNLNDFLHLYDAMKENKEILTGLVKAISSSNDQTYLNQYLKRIIMPFAQTILELVNQINSNQNNTNNESIDIKKLKSQIDYITLIVKQLPDAGEQKVAPIILEITKEMWPLVELLFDKFHDSVSMTEKLCKFMKNCMRALGKQFSDFLLPFFNCVTRNYEIKPLSSYLYCVEFSVTVFGKYIEFDQILKTILEFMCKRTSNDLNTLDKMEDKPDLTEDFFGMLTRYLRYSPRILVNSDTLPLTLEMALLGIGINHLESAKSLYAYIEMLFIVCNLKDQNQSQNSAYQRAVGLLTENYGLQYFKKLIAELIEYPPETVREYIFDVFYAALENFQPPSLNWMQEALLNVPLDILTDIEKINFIKKIKDHHISTKEPTKSLLEHFAHRCKQSRLR